MSGEPKWDKSFDHYIEQTFTATEGREWLVIHNSDKNIETSILQNAHHHFLIRHCSTRCTSDQCRQFYLSHLSVMMRSAGEPAEEASALSLRPCVSRRLAAVLAIDELAGRRRHLPEAVLHCPAAAALVEPGDDVGEDGLHVLVGLTGGEAVPHPRVELDCLVHAGRALVQRAADLRVCHRVSLAVQHEERQIHLTKQVRRRVQSQRLASCD
jgi:hypothetical protein